MQKEFEFPVENKEQIAYYNDRGQVINSEYRSCAKSIKCIDNNHRFYLKVVDGVLFNPYNTLFANLDHVDSVRVKLVKVDQELFQLYLEFLQTGDLVRYSIVNRRLFE